MIYFESWMCWNDIDSEVAGLPDRFPFRRRLLKLSTISLGSI